MEKVLRDNAFRSLALAVQSPRFGGVAALMFATCLALCVSCAPADELYEPIAPLAGHEPSLILGVSSYFSHGWPREHLDYAHEIGIENY